MYHLPAVAAILFYWIRIKVVQQLTCLTLDRPNGLAYSTGEMLRGVPVVHPVPQSGWSRQVHYTLAAVEVTSYELR